MPVFKGVIPIEVRSPAGFDMYGQPTLGIARDTLVKVIKFEDTAEQTSLGSEESASRAKLDEKTTQVEILTYPNFSLSTNDIVTLFGVTLVVRGVFPRYSLRGEHQHNKVSLVRKQ